MPWQKNYKFRYTLLRLAGSLLSPPGPRAKLQILIYHRVLSEQDELQPGEPDTLTFRWHVKTLFNCFNVMPLGEAIQRLRDKTLPSRAACITFDDGYRDNAENALPILREFGLPATFFVTTGFINSGIMWNDRVIEVIRAMEEPVLDLSSIGLGKVLVSDTVEKRQAIKTILPKIKHLEADEREQVVAAIQELADVEIPDSLMMSEEQIRHLRACGMEIGAHTVSHPILASLDSAQALKEIADSKHYLENLLGEPVTLFAYPNGKRDKDFLPEHVEMVKSQGFAAAVTTEWGVSNRQSNPYLLNRFTPWDETPLKFASRLMKNIL